MLGECDNDDLAGRGYYLMNNVIMMYLVDGKSGAVYDNFVCDIVRGLL